MPVFSYKALDGTQRLVKGTVTADTPHLARQSLRGQGLAIAQLQPARPEKRPAASTITSALGLRRRIDPDQVAELWRNLAVLLQAGVPLTQALEICRRQQRGPIEATLRQIHESVRSGQAFAKVLADHPSIADELTRSVIQVGQDSGALPLALLQLAEYQERSRSTANKLATALIYPAVLVVVGAGVVLFLMTYVVPQLVDVLASAGRDLPWPTRVLKAGSDALMRHWLVLLIAIASLLLIVGGWQRTRHGRRWRERLGLSLPIWGDLLRKAWVARIASMLATLLRVDVRFTEALRSVQRNLPHSLYAAELERLQRALEAGTEIAAPLRQSRLIPPLVVHLLAVGQESGELPSMLEQIRVHYDKEVQLALSRFMAIVEPALILVLAAIIGFVVFATLLPILESTRIVQ